MNTPWQRAAIALLMEVGNQQESRVTVNVRDLMLVLDELKRLDAASHAHKSTAVNTVIPPIIKDAP